MMDDFKTQNKDTEIKPPTVSNRVSIPISQPKVEAPTLTKSSAPIVEPLNKIASNESTPVEVKSEATEKAVAETPTPNAPVELSALDVPADSIDKKAEPTSTEIKSEATEKVTDPALPDVIHEEPKTDSNSDTAVESTSNIGNDEKSEATEKVEYKDGFISEDTPLPETPEQKSGDDQKIAEKPLEINTDSGSSSSSTPPIMTPVSTEPVTKIDDIQGPKIETKTGGIPTVEVPEMEDKDVKGKVIPASVEHKKRKVNVMAIVVAIVLALALAGGAGYAYLQNSQDNKTTNVTPTPTKKVEPVKVTPLTSKDIDKASEAVDTSLKELDTTNDIMTADLSDTGLGLL